MGRAFKSEIVQVLKYGGRLEMIWKTGHVTLYSPSNRPLPVDRRSYSAFLNTKGFGLRLNRSKEPTMALTKFHLIQSLKHGGMVRFVHKTCERLLITPSGRIHQLDGRTYAAFVNKNGYGYASHHSGSIEEGNLVIEWGLQ